MKSDLNTERNDIAALEKNMEAHQHLLKAARNGYLPRINAFVNESAELHPFALNRGQVAGPLQAD